MRSDLSVTGSLMTTIAGARLTEEDAIQQMSSGKRLRSVSDDPLASEQLTSLSSAAASLDAYTAGNGPLRARLSAADSALSNAVQLITRAVSLGVEGSNGTLAANERGSIAAELQGIKDQLSSVANSQFNGTYLFSGVRTDAPPFSTSGGSMIYQGAEPAMVEIDDGVRITNGLSGTALFGSDGNNVFDALSGMIQSLDANTSPQSALNDLQTGLSRIITSRVSYGSAMNAVDETATSISVAKQRITEAQDGLDGADLATAASQLAQSQVIQNAASAAFAKIGSLNLFDYLSR